MADPKFSSREEYEDWKQRKFGQHVQQQGPTAGREGALTSCPDCGREVSRRATSCPHCGAPQGTTPTAAPWSDLPPYYQQEFRKIAESGERYRGKWNWAAFLFGGFWGLTKGVWLGSVIGLVGAVLTAGVVGIIYWFVFGVRGNYLYYEAYVKNKQLPI